MTYLQRSLLRFLPQIGGISFALILFSAPAAYAAPGTLSSPFDIGTLWNVCQGYNNPRLTHNGADAYSLDFTGNECDNSASNRTIHSPAAGTVYSYGSTYGSVCLNTLEGRSVALIHIDSSVSAGDNVLAGQAIGSVASPGTRGNLGVSHLHLQMWSTPNCYNTNAVTFDTANNARICGAPDFTVNGPDNANNGTWSGVSFSSQPCDTGPGSPVAVYRLYSPVTKHHLFTADANEALTLRKNSSVWNYEGIAFKVKSLTNCMPDEAVFRFYSDVLRTHLYTMDTYEKSQIITNYPTNVWRYEGVTYCADSKQTVGTKPVYRFYSDLLKSHLYTTDENEKSELMKYPSSSIWRYEGISYYAYSN